MRRFHFGRRSAGALVALLFVSLGGLLQAACMSAHARSGACRSSFLKANEAIGISVRNSEGEILGTIQDIVLERGSNLVSYAVLSFGGAPGAGGKYFAIPWSALSFSRRHGHHFVLDVSIARLRDATGFSRDAYPDTGDPQFATDSLGEGESPPPPASHPELFWRRQLTQLIGTPVENLMSQDIGEIDNAVIDMRQGRLAYAVLSVGGFLGTCDRLCAVPWSAITLAPDLRLARVDANRQTLQDTAFARTRFPNLAAVRTARRIHEWFGMEPYWEVLGYVGSRDLYADWQAGSGYNGRFDITKVTSYEGTISSLGTFRPAPGAADGLSLGLLTNDGRSLILHVAPMSFIGQSGIHFRYGDRIFVSGAPATFGLSNVVMVSEIRKGDQTLRVRDETGRPLWHLGGAAETGPANTAPAHGAEAH